MPLLSLLGMSKTFSELCFVLRNESWCPLLKRNKFSGTVFALSSYWYFALIENVVILKFPGLNLCSYHRCDFMFVFEYKMQVYTGCLDAGEHSLTSSLPHCLVKIGTRTTAKLCA